MKEILAAQLRGYAKELGLSDAEVARRAGLTERQYGFYVSKARRPDSEARSPKLETLVKLAKVLGVTPNDLLGWGQGENRPTKRSAMKQRLSLAADNLQEAELELVVVQVEALAARGKRSKVVRRMK